MANGHVEIHDPFTNHNGLKSGVPADGDGVSDDSGIEDTVEFRLMMVYAKRRRGESVQGNGSMDLNGTLSSPEVVSLAGDVKEEKKRKKRKRRRGLKGWKSLLSCIKPRTSDDGPEPEPEPEGLTSGCGAQFRTTTTDVKDVDELEEAAVRLTELADQIPFVPSSIQTDYPEEVEVEVERLIGLLLREAGDRLNEKELRDVSLARELFWNYSFFKTLMLELLTRMGLRPADPGSPGPQVSPRTQIAVTCEATSRLTALQTLPVNRMLGYGARFLQEQGGYEAAFESDDEDEVH